MTRSAWKVWGLVCLGVAVSLCAARTVHGAAIDERGEISLGVRTYTAARIGAENTDISICQIVGGKTVCGGQNGARNNPDDRQVYRSFTFPYSAAGHLRQNRVYAEVEMDHNLSRLLREGFGPFALLNDLPFKFSKFKYHLVYRGEYEGVYDYGPSEYRTAGRQKGNSINGTNFYNEIMVPPFSGNPADVGKARRRLRNVGSLRNRFFQGYSEMQTGHLLLRFGRQIVAWGETDAFRVVDNINPVDNSFGGFLIPLDERRVPLDMMKANYYIGELGPLYEMFVEAYAAVDDQVGFEPGIPEGSPWALPNLGDPSATTLSLRKGPRRTLDDIRGGGRVVFNAPIPGIEEATIGIAHYYTYVDTPAVQTYIGAGTAENPNQKFPQFIGFGPAADFQSLAVQRAPRVQITGLSSSFALPIDIARAIYLTGQPIIRMELAYFKNEPRFSQSQLDPFIYRQGSPTNPQFCARGTLVQATDGSGTYCTGGRRTGDSWKFVLGLDSNQFIRPLNARQSFFISTQFFYTHLNGAVERRPFNRAGDPIVPAGVLEGEVLPVPAAEVPPAGLLSGSAEPIFIHQPVNQYLQTLLITTQYFSGQVTPSLTFFYDWSGSLATIPQLTLSRDPFRFTIAYNYLYAGTLKGASGVSLLRDRDNVLFQIDYVI